jgi:hypothetical protein
LWNCAANLLGWPTDAVETMAVVVPSYPLQTPQLIVLSTSRTRSPARKFAGSLAIQSTFPRALSPIRQNAHPLPADSQQGAFAWDRRAGR